jgi:hypothetical protein
MVTIIRDRFQDAHTPGDERLPGSLADRRWA